MLPGFIFYKNIFGGCTVKKSKISIPDNYNIDEPLTQSAFGKIAGVNRSTVLRGIKALSIRTRNGKIFLRDNLVYLLERRNKELNHMDVEQKQRFNKLLAAIQKPPTPPQLPKPEPAPPVKPYSVKALENEMLYMVGIFQDEEFVPVVRLYAPEKGEGCEIQPLETGLIFQMDRRGNLENIFLDVGDGHDLELFMQEATD